MCSKGGLSIMDMKDFYSKLSDEQKQKLKECKNQEELLKLSEDFGLELPDEALDGICGGFPYSCAYNLPTTCPKAVDTTGNSCPRYVFG